MAGGAATAATDDRHSVGDWRTDHQRGDDSQRSQADSPAAEHMGGRTSLVSPLLSGGALGGGGGAASGPVASFLSPLGAIGRGSTDSPGSPPPPAHPTTTGAFVPFPAAAAAAAAAVAAAAPRGWVERGHLACDG